MMSDHIQIIKKQVLSVLKHIKVDKSPGSDQMQPRTLWKAREEIMEAFAEIFSPSLSQVKFQKAGGWLMPVI